MKLSLNSRPLLTRIGAAIVAAVPVAAFAQATPPSLDTVYAAAATDAKSSIITTVSGVMPTLLGITVMFLGVRLVPKLLKQFSK